MQCMQAVLSSNYDDMMTTTILLYLRVAKSSHKLIAVFADARFRCKQTHYRYVKSCGVNDLRT